MNPAAARLRRSRGQLRRSRGVVSGAHLDVGIESAEGRVILEEMGGLLGATRVVDADDFEQRVAAAVPATEELAADAAEAVDGNLKLLLGDRRLLVRIASRLRAARATSDPSRVLALR
jgi:hypothetical protein